MDEEKKEIKPLQVQLSWSIPWTAGFLFTIGIIGGIPEISAVPWYRQILESIIAYFLWPLILGVYFAK